MNVTKPLNAVALFGTSAVLLAAFKYQFVDGELPCTLCTLIRGGVILMGMGFLFNLIFGVKQRNYAVTLIGALILGAVSSRFMLIHIVPGGPATTAGVFMGMHQYTVTALGAVAAVVYTAFLMMLPVETESLSTTCIVHKAVIWLFVAMVAANTVSIIIEAGWNADITDPHAYYMISGHV
ncbi:disulfide bond formation protein B [Burkholderia sp. DN3021]|uniref:disulfide bond formation protein B n=1 Tax=Burkholderia sp. DN3021 TaxID=3410137 RepID=UPI003C7BA7C5